MSCRRSTLGRFQMVLAVLAKVCAVKHRHRSEMGAVDALGAQCPVIRRSSRLTKLRVTPSASASFPDERYLPSSSNLFHRCARTNARSSVSSGCGRAGAQASPRQARSRSGSRAPAHCRDAPPGRELPEREVVATVTDFAALWDELFPAEQARIVRLLIERVDVAPDHIAVRLQANGLQTLVEQLRTPDAKAADRTRRRGSRPHRGAAAGQPRTSASNYEKVIPEVWAVCSTPPNAARTLDLTG